MLKEELIAGEIDCCTDILRILEAGKNRRIEADNQENPRKAGGFGRGTADD